MKMNKKKGVTQIEFLMIALLVLLVIFSIIEFALYFFSVQMTNELTRRAARLATVCYIVDRDDIPNLPSLTNIYPPGFEPEDLTISYLDVNGDEVDVSGFLSTPPASSEVLDDIFGQIKYVRAEADYTFRFLVLSLLINAVGTTPEFVTILPTESLGVRRPESGSADIDDC